MLRPGVFLSSKHRELDNELLIALLIRKRRNPQKKSHLKSSLGSCGPSFVCRWLGVATSEHKQFASTHKDTFSRSHLTKQPTGNRTDTSLSALHSLFSEIAAPAVIKPGSHFLPFSAVWITRMGFWVKTQAPPPSPSSPHPPLLQAAGSQRSHFLLGESECRSGAGWGGRKVALSSPSRRARPLPVIICEPGLLYPIENLQRSKSTQKPLQRHLQNPNVRGSIWPLVRSIAATRNPSKSGLRYQILQLCTSPDCGADKIQETPLGQWGAVKKEVNEAEERWGLSKKTSCTDGLNCNSCDSHDALSWNGSTIYPLFTPSAGLQGSRTYPSL